MPRRGHVSTEKPRCAAPRASPLFAARTLTLDPGLSFLGVQAVVAPLFCLSVFPGGGISLATFCAKNRSKLTRSSERRLIAAGTRVSRASPIGQL